MNFKNWLLLIETATISQSLKDLSTSIDENKKKKNEK